MGQLECKPARGRVKRFIGSCLFLSFIVLVFSVAGNVYVYGVVPRPSG